MYSFQCEFGSAIFRKAKFNQQKVRPFDGRPSVSCTFSGAIAQFSTPWSMLLGVIPIANGPKQDTTRRDEMKPVNDKQDVLKKNNIHENVNIMMFFSSKSVTLPATWFQIFAHLPNLSSSGFRKDGSSHTLPGFPKANLPPKSRKPTPPKATPVCYTRARTQRKLRGWTGFVHFVSFHKNHFMKTSKTTWIVVTTKPAQWLHELWNPGWLRETPSYNGWIDLLYLYIQITYTFDIVSSLH